jgi:hypothetical protein
MAVSLYLVALNDQKTGAARRDGKGFAGELSRATLESSRDE